VRELVIPTRWTDFDALGHLTHAAYPVFLDEARDAYLTATVGSFGEWPNVVAHVSIDYVLEVRHPAPAVTVRTAVEAVGRSSVTFRQEIVGPDGSVAASGKGVVVAFDPETRVARPISDDERVRLTAEGEEWAP
jgi:acyl-CoA thioester hydrolase